jgi:hypothetical protein
MLDVGIILFIISQDSETQNGHWSNKDSSF